MTRTLCGIFSIKAGRSATIPMMLRIGFISNTPVADCPYVQVLYSSIREPNDNTSMSKSLLERLRICALCNLLADVAKHTIRWITCSSFTTQLRYMREGKAHRREGGGEGLQPESWLGP